MVSTVGQLELERSVRLTPLTHLTIPGYAHGGVAAEMQLILARDEVAIARFHDSHAAAVRQFCAAVCPPKRVEEAIEAAFLDFLGRAGNAPTANPRELLRRATREVAAGRMQPDGGRPLDPICQALPELLAARANGELSGLEGPILEHLNGCRVCEAQNIRLQEAESAFALWVDRPSEPESRLNARDLQDTVTPQRVRVRRGGLWVRSGGSPDLRGRSRMPTPAPDSASLSMTETVVVTGGAGFIGSHVADALIADGKGIVVIETYRRVTCPGESRASLEKVDITEKTASTRSWTAPPHGRSITLQRKRP